MMNLNTNLEMVGKRLPYKAEYKVWPSFVKYMHIAILFTSGNAIN